MSEQSIMSIGTTETTTGNSGTNSGRTAETTETNSGNDQSKWYYAEGVEGVGEKPDFYIDSKYKSVAEQAKAYPELQKKFGAFVGAPEEYEVALPADLKDLEINKEDPLLASFSEVAKSLNMSQEGYNKILELHARQLEQQSQTSKEALAQEIKNLGPNAKEKVNLMKQWALNNFGEEDASELLSMVTTASRFNVLEKLKAKMVEPAIPKNNLDNSGSFTTLDSLRKDPRYQSDPAYRKMVSERYKQVYGD